MGFWSPSRTLVSFFRRRRRHRAPHVILTIFLDIERTYGQRKPIAQRTPFLSSGAAKAALPKSSSPLATSAQSTPDVVQRRRQQSDLDDILSTPCATEGDTATETEFDTEVEDVHMDPVTIGKIAKGQISMPLSSNSGASTPGDGPATLMSGGRKVLSQHDLLNRYFRRDAVVFYNVDVFR